MKTESKILLSILAGTVVLIIAAVLLLSRNQAPVIQTDEGKVYQIDYSKGYKIGSDSAKLKLVEFSDFQCPACAAAEPLVKQITGRNDPNIQFIYRHFPLQQHLNAKAAANAAEEAGAQGKFWEMHGLLFDKQNEWTNLADPTDYFVGLAKQLQLDENKMREAIANRKYQEKIDADQREGESINVSFTPSFYLNGRLVEDPQRLTQEIDKALAN